MKKAYTYVVFSILLIMIALGGFCVGRYCLPAKPIHDTIAPKIEQYFIKNDSLLRINDSINVKIVEIEKTYEETVNTIINNDLNDNYDFFTNYLQRYSSTHNTGSTQDN